MNNPDQPSITISIVSHGQLDLVKELLKSLREHESINNLEIIITENLSSDAGELEELKSSQITTILNPKPKGFAENHNQAFRRAKGKYFCLINPDVTFIESIFPPLVSDLVSGMGEIVAPLVVDSSGQIQDSFRSLPSLIEIFDRRLRPSKHQPGSAENKWVFPDWIAGIFLLMDSLTYNELGGLDEKYRMYFEDVDFGTRARLRGYRLVVNTAYRIQHDAKRESRENVLLLLQHTISAIRFFSSPTYRVARKLNSC